MQPTRPMLEPPPVAADVVAHPPRTRLAILTLLLFAPIIGESLASFNTPPLKYVSDPSSLPFLIAFYGVSAVLMRDIIRRRKLGWVSWTLLGIAFGAVNEGVIAATWFQSSGKPVGDLVHFARIGGVNTYWALLLTMYHVIYSTTIPILLAESFFPGITDQPWLGRKGRRALVIILALVCSLGLLIATYRPYRIAALAIAVLLVVVALVLPAAQPRLRNDRLAPRLWTLRLVGFGCSGAFFLALFALPVLVRNPLIATGISLAALALLVWRLRTWTARVDWERRHTVALASGALGVGIALSPLFWAVGEPLIGAIALGLLIWLARRVGTSAAPVDR